MTTIPVELLVAICSLLFASNLFFIRRLIAKIDKTEVTSGQTRLSLKLLTSTVRLAGRDLEEIKSELKHIHRLETDVAVLKSYFGSGLEPKHS